MKRMKGYVYSLFMASVLAVVSGCGGSGASSSQPTKEQNTGSAAQPAASATPGVTDTSIKLGVLNDFSGGASYQGSGGQDGLLAYVDYINKKGGIHGRKIELVSEDNSYTPAGGVNGSKKLVTQEKVFAIPYSIGSGPTVAIKDYVNQQGVPVIAAGEGTEIFQPASKYLFGVGTPYSYQGAIAVRYVAETLSKGEPVKIAFMGQDDAFGKDPYKGVELAVTNYNQAKIVFTGFHKRDAVEVSDQVLQLKQAGADYVLISANVERTAIIVKELSAQKVPLKGIFSLSLASIDKRIFEVAGTEYIDRYYGIQSFYTWDQPDRPEVKQVIDILKEQGRGDVIEKKNTFFWYGWNNMSIIANAIEKAGKDLTREGVVQALESFQQTKTGSTTPPITYGQTKRVSGTSAFVVKTEQGEDGIVWKPVTDYIQPPENVMKELGF